MLCLFVMNDILYLSAFYKRYVNSTRLKEQHDNNICDIHTTEYNYGGQNQHNV